ncbi:MAG: thiamine-phosphate kinase [Pseudomonadota bacterium]
MNEFEMIQKYFLPLSMGRQEAEGLQDDAAILEIPEGHDLVISSDTLNGGTHFLKNEDAANIAHKALRVNLSDMAAMGAKPYCYQMNLAFSQFPDEAWVKDFSAALLEDNKAFGVFCSGGDTTVAEGPLLVSITVTGLVPKGRAVRRSTAQAGDLVVLTGPVGRAAVGVKVLLGVLELEYPQKFLDVCHKPEPRTVISEEISKYARAAVDVSDGLIADLGHVCSTSGVGAKLDLDKIPFTDDTKALIDAETVDYEALLTGGDDYEIAMAVPPEHIEAFTAESAAKGVALSVIGTFEAGKGVEVIDPAGAPMEFTRQGWTHF